MVRPTHKESRVTRRMDEWRRWLPVYAFRCSARRTFHSTTVHRGWQVKDLEHAYTKTRAHTQQPFLINYSLFHVCILYSILRCVVIFYLCLIMQWVNLRISAYLLWHYETVVGDLKTKYAAYHRNELPHLPWYSDAASLTFQKPAYRTPASNWVRSIEI